MSLELRTICVLNANTCRTSTTTSYATSTPATSSNASTSCVRCRMSVVCHMLFLIRVFRICIELFTHIIQTLWISLDAESSEPTHHHFHRSCICTHLMATPLQHHFPGWAHECTDSLFIFIVRSLVLAQGPPTCLAEIARITVGCS